MNTRKSILRNEPSKLLKRKERDLRVRKNPADHPAINHSEMHSTKRTQQVIEKKGTEFTCSEEPSNPLSSTQLSTSPPMLTTNEERRTTNELTEHQRQYPARAPRPVHNLQRR